jgi:hypothetical protein
VEAQTDILIAAVAAVLAATAVVAASGALVAGRRAGARLRAETAELAVTERRLAADVSALGRTLAAASATIEGYRRIGTDLTDRMEDFTSTMAHARKGIEHLNRRRLSPAIRALRLVSLAARVAYLWR